MNDAPRLPAAGSTISRVTARVLPVDAASRVLLLYGWDPARPESPYWFTIGGAVETDESLAEAAVRELREEAGGPRRAAGPSRPGAGRHHRVRLGQLAHRPTTDLLRGRSGRGQRSFAGQDAWERSTIDDHGWWHPDDLQAAGSVAHPSILEAMRAAVQQTDGG